MVMLRTETASNCVSSLKVFEAIVIKPLSRLPLSFIPKEQAGVQ